MRVVALVELAEELVEETVRDEVLATEIVEGNQEGENSLRGCPVRNFN